MNYIKKIEWLLENRVQTAMEHCGIARIWKISFYDWKARDCVINPSVEVTGLTFDNIFKEALLHLSSGGYGRYMIECTDEKNNGQKENWRGDLLEKDFIWPEVLEEV